MQKIDLNLRSYVKTYKNWINTNLCNDAIEAIKNEDWEKHKFYYSHTGDLISKSGNKELETLFIDPSKSKEIMQRIWDVYFRYITELQFPWFGGWNGFHQVRYNRYNEGQLMALHCDHIQDIFDGNRKGIPVLTALGLLNDDFEGGDFIIWDEKIELKKGDMVVFPSIFLYPHEVSEVTKGTRYSFVSWAW